MREQRYHLKFSLHHCQSCTDRAPQARLKSFHAPAEAQAWRPRRG
ncbi:MAG: viroplasmin family protein [bacterium]|nr:viroplasmin family protein [bacterium]